MSPLTRDFIDNFGLITQRVSKGADGGDSTHRFGVFVASEWLADTPFEYFQLRKESLKEYYYSTVGKYEVSKDVYVRHPDPEKWYSSPLNFSRDQTRMLLAAMVVMDDKERVGGLAKKLLKNFGLHPNIYPNWCKPGDSEYKKKFPDPIIPSEISAIIRGMELWWAYPALFFLDSFLFLDILFAVCHDRYLKQTGERTDQHTMLLVDFITAMKRYPTPVSFLARQLYKFTDFEGALKWIFDQERSNDPPLDIS